MTKKSDCTARRCVDPIYETEPKPKQLLWDTDTHIMVVGLWFILRLNLNKNNPISLPMGWWWLNIGLRWYWKGSRARKCGSLFAAITSQYSKQRGEKCSFFCTTHVLRTWGSRRENKTSLRVGSKMLFMHTHIHSNGSSKNSAKCFASWSRELVVHKWK